MAGAAAKGRPAISAWLVTNRWLQWDKFEQQFGQLQAAADATTEGPATSAAGLAAAAEPAPALSLTRMTTDEVVARLAADSARAGRTAADPAAGADSALPAVALFMDKDVAAAAQLEARGVRCVNSARAIALCDNKALTHAVLEAHGIAHAPTITAPLVYRALTRAEWGASGFVASVEKQLRFPVVLKHAVGSWGSGVFLARSRDELLRLLEEAGTTPVIAEAFIAESAGSDARVYMVGDEPVAAMRRRAAGGDFRANITGGGSATPWDPPAAYVDTARVAMRALGLDIAAVDFLRPDGPAPMVGEVNSNAQFVTLAQTTGVDVAPSVVNYLRRTPRH